MKAIIEKTDKKVPSSPILAFARKHRGLTEGKAAFTIIELLTVMSIIVILFGLLVPAMTMVKRYAKLVKQQAQFHSIEAGLQMYHDEFNGYPPSDGMDRKQPNGEVEPTKDYPGAMKLAEAMLGQDLLGFHPKSFFALNGHNDSLPSPYNVLYPVFDKPNPSDVQIENLRSRSGPYLPIEGINAYRIKDLYASVSQDVNNLVLCDEYPRVKHLTTGKRVGMPVLYYRANTSNVGHASETAGVPTTLADDKGNIYDSMDNQFLIELGVPGSSTKHPIATDGTLKPLGFYTDMIRNKKISATPRPYNADTFILMSAGFDGLYGTPDDVFNFKEEE